MKPLCSLDHIRYKTAIKYIQLRTYTTIAGIYGDETVSLIKAYQKTNKLIADGIVCKGTLECLPL